MEEITLKGSSQQQATQLWELVKTREISAETLCNIMPNTLSFYKELINCINNEISSDKEISSKAIEVYKESLSKLSSGLTDSNLDQENKKAIAEIIKDINIAILEIVNNHTSKSALTKNLMILSGAVFGICGIIAILTAKKRT